MPWFSGSVAHQDYTQYIQAFSQNNSVCDISNDLTLDVDTRAPAIQPASLVEFDLDGTRWFTGYTTSITAQRSAGQWVNRVVCDHYSLKRLRDYFWSEGSFAISNNTVNRVLDLAMDRAGAIYSIDPTLQPAFSEIEIPPYEWSMGQNAYDVVVDMALFGMVQILPRSDGSLYVTRLSPSRTPTDVSNRATYSERRVDDAFFRTSSLVLGWATEAAFVSGSSPYGYPRTMVVANPHLISGGPVLAMAQQLLDEYNQLQVLEKNTIPTRERIVLGDSVVNSSESWHSQSAIVMRTASAASESGFLQTLTTGEKCPKIFGFEPMQPEALVYLRYDVVFKEYVLSPLTQKLYYTHRLNGIWSASVQVDTPLSHAGEMSYSPRIATNALTVASSNLIHCAWWTDFNTMEGHATNVLYNRVELDTTTGAVLTVRTPVRINAIEQNLASHGCVAVDGHGRVTVLFDERTYYAGVYKNTVYISTSTDNGVTWGVPVAISDSSQNYTADAIAANDYGDLAILYSGDTSHELHFYWIAYGQEGTDTVISGADVASYGDVNFSGGALPIHLVACWLNTSTVRFSELVSGVWSEPIDISVSGAARPRIGADTSDNVSIVWALTGGPPYAIKERRRLASNPSVWTDDVSLNSNTNSVCLNPAVDVAILNSDSIVAAAFIDTVGGEALPFFRKTTLQIFDDVEQIDVLTSQDIDVEATYTSVGP